MDMSSGFGFGLRVVCRGAIIWRQVTLDVFGGTGLNVVDGPDRPGHRWFVTGSRNVLMSRTTVSPRLGRRDRAGRRGRFLIGSLS